ncbi:hypothetical protein AVEN_233165-1 [Araneus ventricosus]|uniref:Uncharacterized protein n=1 Tax=Araneus ventricosus TaxID=182803 RepID=A0A4Y2EJ83_ARAVE|nr:hypothetical protein AVEN_233165-1 [Araneus ventricosus]
MKRGRKRGDSSEDKVLKKVGDIPLTGSFFLLVCNKFDTASLLQACRMMTTMLAITCFKLVANLQSCRVKLVANLEICRARLLPTKITIWDETILEQTWRGS